MKSHLSVFFRQKTTKKVLFTWNNAVCKGCRFIRIFLKNKNKRLFCFLFFRRMKKVRFQIGVKRKPPRGQRLSILLGRNWWDVSQSLKKAPGARTAIFSQSCSVKSHLLIFFRQDTTKKGLSTRHINFTIQEKLLHGNRGFFMIFCLKSHLFFLFFFGRETHRSKKRSYYYRKPRWGILFFRDYSRILYQLFWDYTDRLGFQEDSHWIPFGLRDSIWIMGFHWDYL